MPSLSNRDSDIECPPLDSYTLRFTNASDIFLGDAWGEQNKPEGERKQEKKIDLAFVVADFDYDPDVDDRDWNGFEIENRYTIGVDFNHTESKIGAMIRALERIEKVPDDYDRELEELYGRKIKATVGPSPKGWPRISSPMALRVKKEKPAPAPRAVESEYDDGADLFDEDAVA